MTATLKYWSFFILICSALTSVGQTNFVAAVDKNPVAVNDRFKFTLTIQNAKGNITPPDLSEFNLIFGPAKSTSYQFINGQSSNTITYTYTLSPKKTGEFTIGEAVANTDEGNFKSKPITLKVVEGSSSASGQPGQTGRSGAQSGRNVQGNDELLAEIRFDKNKIYKGEQVVVTYYIYSRYRNIDFTDYQFPATNGFYSHEFSEEQAGWQNQLEVINGKQYRVAILKKQILFPQQHGKLKLDPMSVSARVDYSFFNPGRTVKAVSNAPEIEVLPLPNPPAGFKGDVGSFQFNVKTDRNTVEANDAITLTATVSGRGNLKLVNAPNIPFPKDFEVYDPKITNRFSTASGGLSGSREFEYLIIPRHAGKYTIEPIAYTYFDISSKSFKTIRTEAFEIEVKRGSGDPAGVTYSGSDKEDVVILDQDIRYIKPVETLHTDPGQFFRSPLFYGLLFFPPVLLIIFYIARRKYIAQQQDVASVRRRKAGKMARKLLSEANKNLKANNREGFYDAVFKALYGYLGGKLNIDPAGLSREQISSGLESRGVDEQTNKKLLNLLSHCEMARFSQSDNLDPQADYTAAAQLIGELQKKL